MVGVYAGRKEKTHENIKKWMKMMLRTEKILRIKIMLGKN